jgi:ribose transport system permease protein
MLRRLSSAYQQSGLLLVILALGVVMTMFAGSHVDRLTNQPVNNFLNAGTLMQVATDASFFAIMAVGMTAVIITGGIDLSIGSIYAMCGVLTGIALRKMEGSSPAVTVLAAIALCAGIGLFAGWLNGFMVSRLGVHPFIITLGTMWVYRGIAFVSSKAESILVPESLTNFTKANLGLRKDLFPLPMVVMLLVAIVGSILLTRTVWGRRVFAVGGNISAAQYSGVPIRRILTSVYLATGFTAGIAALMGVGFYGSASSGDAQGYELYVIAAAVVGGASLTGGKGAASGALLGAILITMIRQSIRTLGLDQNYEWIIIGVAIVAAVVLDRVNAGIASRRLTHSGGD